MVDYMELITTGVLIIFYTGIYVSQVKAMSRKIDNLEKHNEEQDRRLNRQDIVVENINVNIEFIKHELEMLNKQQK